MVLNDLARPNMQRVVAAWITRTWGKVCLDSKQERVMRLLEEALELAQSEELPEATALHLVRYVYNRPAGEPYQEAAGVGVCLMAYAASKDFDIQMLEVAEIDRVLKVPVEKLRSKHAIKVENFIGIASEYE